MDKKNKGGRGQKAENPYARGSFTLPPELKKYLDSQAEKHQVSMSEMLARILQQHQEMTSRPQPQQPAVIPEGESTTPPVRGTSKARTAPKKEKSTGAKQADSLPERVEVVTSVIERKIRGQLKWTKERYAQIEELLRQGSFLVRQDSGADWITERGDIVSWRTVEALKKMNIVQSNRLEVSSFSL